ncbi:MAG: ABC transporter substrate-binding protein, partial [Acetobacteraceae bacterium]
LTGQINYYMIGRLAEKLGFDAKTVTLRPVQMVPNMIAAVQSNQVDAAIAIASMAKPLAANGQAHIIGWISDILPYQITALFATERTITTRTDALHRFARAYRHGVADYRATFLRLDAEGHPIVDATTDAAIPLITRYVFTGDPKARQKILAGVGYYNPDGALDVQDVLAQFAWFKAQGLVKGDRDPNTLIDTSFLPAL